MGGGGMGGNPMQAMMAGMGIDINSVVMSAARIQPGSSFQRTEQQQVQVRNLPGDTTDTDLYKLCSPFGALCPKGVKAMLTGEGQCTGTGWVDFVNEEDAAMASQNLNGFMGMKVQTKWVKPAA